MTPTRPLFPWPDDQLAWTSFLVSLGGAWLLYAAWAPGPTSWALSLAAVGAFLSSDWMSMRMGRSRGGIVPPNRHFSWQGALLVTLMLLSMLWLLKSAPPQDRTFWIRALGSIACLNILVFVLRLEWVALDARLVFLTHLLLTSPALLLGFAHWGPLNLKAFQAWALPATFFSSQALLSIFWFDNRERYEHAPSLWAVPLLTGALILIAWGYWGEALFLLAFLIRGIFLLDRRMRQTGLDFGKIRRLTFELHGWSLAAAIVWLLNFWT